MAARNKSPGRRFSGGKGEVVSFFRDNLDFEAAKETGFFGEQISVRELEKVELAHAESTKYLGR